MRESTIAATQGPRPGDISVEIRPDFSQMSVQKPWKPTSEPAPAPVVEVEAETFDSPAPSWSPDSPEFGILLVKAMEINGKYRPANTPLAVPFDIDAGKADELIQGGAAIRENCLTVRCLSGWSYPHSDYAGGTNRREFKGQRGQLLLYLGRADDHLLRMGVDLGNIEILPRSIGTGRWSENLAALPPCPKAGPKPKPSIAWDPRSPILAAHRDIAAEQQMRESYSR
jgi:hypothetical protein